MVDQQIIRHLTRGWQTFVGIIANLTGAGVKLPQEEIDRLERMRAEVGVILEKQKQLGKPA